MCYVILWIVMFQSACPSPLVTLGDTSEMFWNPLKITDASWNFEKFLVDASGKPRYRFAPEVTPLQVAKYVKKIKDEE